MSELILALLPEMLGLLITPAAIAGCVLLLQSQRPLANAASFGSAFVLVYSQVGVAALLGGASDPGATSATVSHWAGLIVGLVFLACGAGIAMRRPGPGASPPRFLTELENAGPRQAFAAGLVLAIVNPNLVIMMSGMSLIASSDTTTSQAVLATVALLAAAALDFLIPIGIYLALGERARNALDAAKQWMLAHNHTLTVAVLFGFGILFTARGITNLT
ncbi:hypothetical protein NN3_35970 [Nocardia neocaledoniensis NBRC 108232]|uniref:Sap-like sulfolipid-1-addressing protein n=1 Tax=Nocardia neocaledoniensis TaxID=236511 RepID=A0A317ND55_9NOCA|nr:GAP family protein [Nocardia neocaledoniensis]PWV72737.1 Sap-like sulfolipid-1-addressing protein [Nocardia neocaledoniensis]GEM32590.1 hypothetical protein NN3_35970 [Nocardia neocaledoniensis NBRC 108232]